MTFENTILHHKCICKAHRKKHENRTINGKSLIPNT